MIIEILEGGKEMGVGEDCCYGGGFLCEGIYCKYPAYYDPCTCGPISAMEFLAK